MVATSGGCETISGKTKESGSTLSIHGKAADGEKEDSRDQYLFCQRIILPMLHLFSASTRSFCGCSLWMHYSPQHFTGIVYKRSATVGLSCFHSSKSNLGIIDSCPSTFK